MNSTARNRIRRMTGALRMNRPPALSAASGRSAATAARRRDVAHDQHHDDTDGTTRRSARTPASARRHQRPGDRGTDRPCAVHADNSRAPRRVGICSRGTSSGWIACRAGRCLPAADPEQQRQQHRRGCQAGNPVSDASTPTPAAMAACVAINRRRRSTRSASTPDGNASSITGSVVAV